MAGLVVSFLAGVAFASIIIFAFEDYRDDEK